MPSLVEPALPRGRMAALAQPVIHADGILLRPWQPSDRPAVLAAYADPAIQRCLASCQVAQHAGFAAEGTKRGEARHADGWQDMHMHARLDSDR